MIVKYYIYWKLACKIHMKRHHGRSPDKTLLFLPSLNRDSPVGLCQSTRLVIRRCISRLLPFITIRTFCAATYLKFFFRSTTIPCAFSGHSRCFSVVALNLSWTGSWSLIRSPSSIPIPFEFLNIKDSYWSLISSIPLFFVKRRKQSLQLHISLISHIFFNHSEIVSVFASCRSFSWTYEHIIGSFFDGFDSFFLWIDIGNILCVP